MFILSSPNDICEELSGRLRRHRLHQNLTQAMLAEMAGVSIGAIRTLEKDGQTSMQTFIRVVMALGLTRELETLFTKRTLTLEEMEKIAANSERQRARGTR